MWDGMSIGRHTHYYIVWDLRLNRWGGEYWPEGKDKEAQKRSQNEEHRTGELQKRDDP